MKRLVFSIIALFVLSACSKSDENEEIIPDDKEKVVDAAFSFHSNIQSVSYVSETRALTEGSMLPYGFSLGIFTRDNNTLSISNSQYQSVNQGELLKVGVNPDYCKMTPRTQMEVLAYYPYDSNVNQNNPYIPVEITSNPADQTDYLFGKVMTTYLDYDPNTEIVRANIPLKHALCRVKIFVKTDNEDYDGEEGYCPKLSKITIETNFSQKGRLNVFTGEIDPANDGTLNSFSHTLNPGNEIRVIYRDDKEGYDDFGEFIFLPNASAIKSIKLTGVDENGSPFTDIIGYLCNDSDGPDDNRMTLESGKCYQLSIIYKKRIMLIQETGNGIDPWVLDNHANDIVIEID